MAIFGSDDVNFHVPDELEVGGAICFGASPNVAVIGAKVPRVGMWPNTSINIEAVPCDKMFVAA